MRLVRTIDSTGYHSGTVTYDLNGNVLTTTDANGNVTTNTYDALNRVLTSDAVHPTDASKNVSKSYTYDNMGRIKKAVNNDFTTTYQYDSLGRKYTESECRNDYEVFRGYFYEGISQYVKQELTGKSHLLIYSNKEYAYDDEMRVVNVQESGNDITAYTYDANGNKLTETMANGVVSTYSYNKANKVTGIVNTSGEMTISEYKYSYYLDGSDACKKRTEDGIIEVTSYEYDGLKRLTQESVTAGSTTDTYTYEYDDYGNRAKMTATGSANFTTVYDYADAQGNYTALLQKEIKTSADELPLPGQEVTPEQTVYTYDANGSQLTKTTSEKTETNIYNAVNQLVGFADGETTASYAYNVNGLRVEKVVDGQRTNHVWDGSQQIVVDVIDSLYYEAQCYIRGTSLAATYRYQNAEKSGYTYYVQNAHGDVMNLTDADGAVTKTYRYDAFGVERNISDADTNAFRYCGEYYDAETGTVYLRARYYNPSIGRFTQRDSYAGKSEDPLSLNLYTYCYNAPLHVLDPSGHTPAIAVAGILFLAAAVAIGVTTLAVASTPTGKEALNKTAEAVGDLGDRASSKFRDASNMLLFMTLAGLANLVSNAKNSNPTKDNRDKKRQSVYLLYDPSNNNSIEYVGRTTNIEERRDQHKHSKNRSDLQMVVIAYDLEYSEARGLEQMGIMFYGTYNPLLLGGNLKNNQINGISPVNVFNAWYIIKAAPYIPNLLQVMTFNERNAQLTFRDSSRNKNGDEEDIE